MSDTVSPSERSQIMSKVKGSKNKSTELKLIQYFTEYGITGWRRNYPLLGRPDIVFPKVKLAVFVDGCFWHGCETHCRIPKSNNEYWIDKINKNVERDIKTTNELLQKNWMVIRVWEHDLKRKSHKKILLRIKEFVEQDAKADR